MTANCYVNAANDEMQAPMDGISAFEEVLKVIDTKRVARVMKEERIRGRKGHPIEPLLKAHLYRYFCNLPSINEEIRQLQDSPRLREVCGFEDVLPHRTTFSRFFKRLGYYVELIGECLDQITEQVGAMLPGFGEVLAIDSTTVRTHGNPHRKNGKRDTELSDPEASWTAKNSARAKEGGKEWHYGYKMHAVCDARYGLPVSHYVTTAKRHDSPTLPVLMDKAIYDHLWMDPQVVIADRGYDARSNHDYLIYQDIIPIIHIKRPGTKDGLYKGLSGKARYDKNGAPTCMGGIPMQYVLTDFEKGDLYRCAKGGCELQDKSSGAMLYRDSEVWEPIGRNPRLRGPIRRDTPEWKELYRKRYSIERIFKTMKEARSLERHYHRGLRNITLHVMLSTLVFQATALVKALAGELDELRWMVRRVA